MEPEEKKDAAFGLEEEGVGANSSLPPIMNIQDFQDLQTGKEVKKEKTNVIVNGKVERKKRAVALGISEFMLPPLTKSIAQYQLIQQDKIDPSLVPPAPPDPGDAVFPGTYSFTDKYQQDPSQRSDKMMINWGRNTIDTAKDDPEKKFLKREIKDIEFINGIKRVNPQIDYLEYLFMELHPRNKSNKHRDPTADCWFERTDIQVNKSEQFMAAQQDLAFEAGNAVAAITDRDLILGYATSSGGIMVDGKQTGIIKSDLRKWAYENPKKFFKMHKDSTPGIRLNVLDAMDLGLIAYDHDRKTFFDSDTKMKLYTHPVGKEPVEDLVEYLKKTPEIYSLITALLDYWE